MRLQKFPEVKYIRNDKNYGFSKGCNVGYQNATCDNVMFLNNDIKVTSHFENWTDEIIQKCNQGLVGPTMGLLDKHFSFVKEENKLLFGNSYMSGWCLSSSKENWKKLEEKPGQVFSEDFFAYFEDTDLSFRAREKNIPFVVVNIPVVHFGKVSSKQINTYELYKKGKDIFTKKWHKLQKKETIEYKLYK